MADRTPAGPYCTEISIDFNNVLARANEIAELAEKLDQQGDQIMDGLFTSGLWTGTGASAFRGRTLFLSRKIKSEASRLKALARILQFAAESLKKVEEKAKDIFNSGKHGGSGR